MNKTFIGIGAFTGAAAVILGAFGAHALKAIVTPEHLLSFETGVRYQFYHAFALILVGILHKEFSGKLLGWAGILFMLGIMLFSGSLYLLSTKPDMKWLGPVTPLGGVCFISGWIFFALACLKKN
jgi:uncharacterized membrane protein YgdD (TMEM256/DUF423 family)